ncbi:DUF2842 domain-containing protein [Sphingopyxis macrogoltabida]|nr:DUF2842 domain-containing protein [Sphingopyxis macrogoltabida]ALJ13128.1 hypothetical protein LH19_09620 [Sphingopyxis macrogoltabida]
MNQDRQNPVGDQHQPTWRKPAGMFLILLLIAVWAVIIVGLSPWVGTWPVLVQAVFYLVTGVIWIMPLKPLLRWMELGRWRG